MANKPFSRPRSKSDPTAESNSYRKKYEELVEFKVGWKQKYERMEMQYKALNDEKASLEGENIALKMSVSQLEEQLILLEHERKGIAEALNTEQYRNVSLELRALVDTSTQTRLEEQLEAMRCHLLFYKGNYERERKSCEELKGEIENARNKLHDAEKEIKMLTSQLAAAREAYRRSKNANLGERCLFPLHQIRFIHPYHPVDEIWQLQQRRGAAFPRNRKQMSFCYRGDVKVFYHEEL